MYGFSLIIAILGFLSLCFFDPPLSTAIGLSMICMLLGLEVFRLIESFSYRVNQVFGCLEEINGHFDRVDQPK